MPQSDVPLLYSSLSTRHSTYPRWVLLTSSPIPILMKRSDLGNEICQGLLSSNRALPVPPLVNDIVELLSWLLTEAPFPLATSYASIAISLRCVCDVSGSHHIHPFEAHFKITMIAMSSILSTFSPMLYNAVMAELRPYLQNRWGRRIAFVGFKNLLLDSYDFIHNNFHFV